MMIDEHYNAGRICSQANNYRDERGPGEALSLFSGNGGLASEAPPARLHRETPPFPKGATRCRLTHFRASTTGILV